MKKPHLSIDWIEVSFMNSGNYPRPVWTLSPAVLVLVAMYERGRFMVGGFILSSPQSIVILCILSGSLFIIIRYLSITNTYPIMTNKYIICQLEYQTRFSESINAYTTFILNIILRSNKNLFRLRYVLSCRNSSLF